MSDLTPRVAFVIPAKNEAESIEALLADVDQACRALEPYEIVYVDDGSTDDTQERLRAAQAVRPHLRIARHARSAGKSAALRTGIQLARAPLVVTLDGDGQNDPQFAPQMVAILEASPDVGLVAGQRLRRGDGLFKKWQSRIANAARKALLNDGTRDTACGLKAIRRELFLNLPYFDTVHRFFPALVAREGYRVAHLDVVDRPRFAGTSHFGLLDRLLVGVPDLFGVWWLTRRRRVVPEMLNGPGSENP